MNKTIISLISLAAMATALAVTDWWHPTFTLKVPSFEDPESYQLAFDYQLPDEMRLRVPEDGVVKLPPSFFFPRRRSHILVVLKNENVAWEGVVNFHSYHSGLEYPQRRETEIRHVILRK